MYFRFMRRFVSVLLITSTTRTLHSIELQTFAKSLISVSYCFMRFLPVLKGIIQHLTNIYLHKYISRFLYFPGTDFLTLSSSSSYLLLSLL